MPRVKREQSVEFVCIGTCEDPPTWMAEGRFNADGEFEPLEGTELCPECFEVGEPTDNEIVVAGW